MTPTTITVRRDPESKLLLQVSPDQGTPERANRQGGVQEGYRQVLDGGVATVKGVWANASGVFEAIDHLGFLAMVPTKDRRATSAEDRRRMRLDAGENLRDLAVRAGLQRKTTGLYGVRVAGKKEESDKMAVARAVLHQRGQALGWWRLYMLLDILVLEQIPQMHKIEGCMEALDAYAALMGMDAPKAAGGSGGI